MDFDENETWPVSIRALLRQQVEEQSYFCDFTVKHELWSKRYHACVASVSPFVQAMTRNDFNEQTKGFLELKLFSPEYIDMAMMFLYGEAPMLTLDNVSEVLHLAEFLLIPNLKAFCVEYVNDTEVDVSNVERLLHLTSLFNFEMPTLMKYCRQHLPELLSGRLLLDITFDTLESMFLDETLSYVSADMRFEFVIRWVEHSPEQRKPKLDKIVAGIELPEVSAALVEKAKGDINFENLYSLFESEAGRVGQIQNVLITYGRSVYGHFWVFDYDRDRLYKLERSTPHPLKNTYTFTSGESILCLVEKTSKTCVIRLHDFPVLGELSSTSVSRITSHNTKAGAFDKIYISNKVCYAVFKDKVTIKKKMQSLSEGKQRVHRRSLSRNHTDDFGTVYSEREYTTLRPTLCMGEISECGKETCLTPLMSMNVSFVINLVVNEAKCIALFSTSQNFFCIYDEKSCKIETIDIKLECTDEVSPFNDGFAINGGKKIRFIQPRTGSCFKRKFSVYETCLKASKRVCTYRAVGNKWVRFISTENSLDYTLDELGRVSVDDAEWRLIPLPVDYADISIIRNFQEIGIPRSKLKCNLRCPHCSRIVEFEERKRISLLW